MITAQEAGDDAMAQAEMATLATLAPAWDYPVGWQVERLANLARSRAGARWKRELARRPQAGLELRLSYPRLLVMVKRYDAARDAFVQLASNKYPHQPEVAYAIGVLSYELKDCEEAERSLRDALALGYREPDLCASPWARWRKSANCRKKPSTGTKPSPAARNCREHKAGWRCWKPKMASWTPRWPGWSAWPTCKTHRARRACWRKRNWRAMPSNPTALAILSAALAKDGNVAEWRYERALLLDDRERVAEAERDLRAYLKLKPKSAQGLNALGYILANRTGRIREARELVSRALKLDPDNPMILDSMGWVEYRSASWKPRCAICNALTT
ncbi:MAG: tetratricopeptide repeat protein [Rivihabitans pingtungensis]